MLSLGSEPKQLVNVPISVSLVDNMTVGIYGEYIQTVNMIKSLILQMVSLHSYDELKVILICDESDEKEWSFTKFIPHFGIMTKPFVSLLQMQMKLKRFLHLLKKTFYHVVMFQTKIIPSYLRIML